MECDGCVGRFDAGVADCYDLVFGGEAEVVQVCEGSPGPWFLWAGFDAETDEADADWSCGRHLMGLEMGKNEYLSWTKCLG